MTLHSAWLRLRWLFQRSSRESELDEELRFHMESQAEQLVKTGVPPAEAARRVRLEFGGLDQVKEECRAERGLLLESLWADLRYGCRSLRKTPAFTLTALASLALGIGANTALFTTLDYAFWRPLAVREPGALCAFRSPGPHLMAVAGSEWTMSFSYPVYRELQDHGTSLEGILATFGSRTSVAWRGRAEHMNVEFTSGNYFELLGASPAAGRLYTPRDDRDPGAHPVAVLTDAAWRLKFGADPAIVGQTIAINRVPMTIVGISQRGFSGIMRGDSPDVYVPFAMYQVLGQSWFKLDTHNMDWVLLVGRLKPGLPVEQALAELNVAYQGVLRSEVEHQPRDWPGRQQYLNRKIEFLPAGRGILWGAEIIDRAGMALMGLVGCVLLIACTNLTGLGLARNLARSRELAVRSAVGAGRFRIARQLLTETLLLTAGGGLLGFGLAWLGAPSLLKVFFGADALAVYSAQPDLRITAFTLAVCLGAGLFTGLIPALRAGPASLQDALRGEAGATPASSHLRLRSLLVGGEIALAVVLTSLTVLAGRTLYNLRTSNLGFREEGIVQFGVNARLDGYKYEALSGLYENLRQQIAGLPGVRAVALSDLGVMDQSAETNSFEIADGAGPRQTKGDVNVYDVSPAYFRVLGIPVLAGREFERPDEPAAVVNLTFARRFFGGKPAVGAHIRKPGGRTWRTITAVVADEKHFSYRQEPTPYVYFPWREGAEVFFYAKTAGNPAAVLPAVRALAERVFPGVPLRSLNTLSQHIESSMASEKALGVLVTAFCILALLLTAVGIYGLVSYNVARRTRELAIRISLGAGRRRILADLFAGAGFLVAAGVTAGLAATLGLTRLLKSFVYGIDPADPLSLAAAALSAALFAALATFFPARRATRIDPMRALRLE